MEWVPIPSLSIVEPGSATVLRRVYGPHSEQFGELRLPAGTGPHPLVVWLHGGGWQAFITLDGAAGMCTALTVAGTPPGASSYRRIGNGGGWPATFDDC